MHKETATNSWIKYLGNILAYLNISLPMNILLKRTIFFLLIATISYAQEVSVTDAKGTIKTVRNNRVAMETNAPNMPIEGDIWINPSTSTTKIYSGTDWFEIGGGGSSSSALSVYTGSFTITRSSRNNFQLPITGLPFVPSQITFVAHMNVPDLSQNNSNENPSNMASIWNAVGTMHGFVRKNGTSNKVQSVLFSGIHGYNPDDISLFSSNQHCIGLRYTNNQGINVGIIKGSLRSFDSNGNNFGFTIQVEYVRGSNNDVFNQDLEVFYTAYK